MWLVLAHAGSFEGMDGGLTLVHYANLVDGDRVGRLPKDQYLTRPWCIECRCPLYSNGQLKWVCPSCGATISKVWRPKVKPDRSHYPPCPLRSYL